jgi:hypothetical protein
MIGHERGRRITERPPLGTICAQKPAGTVPSDLEAGQGCEVKEPRVTGIEATCVAGDGSVAGRQ